MVLVAAPLLACREARPVPDARNVLLITLDGLRQDHLSGRGYPRPTSPNLDWIASQGIFFDTIVPSGCSTKASLTSLLTSADYNTHRLLEHDGVLADSFLTLAEVFYAAGWETGAFVATPHLKGSLGYAQGFEHFEDFSGFEEDYVPADQVVGAARAALLARGASPERPFFYYLHIEEPHPPWRHGSPWLPAAGQLERPFERGCTYIPSQEELSALSPADRERIVGSYDGAIQYADLWIGVLLATLRQLGEMEHTVVAVSTDHGLELLDRYSVGHGQTPYDEVTRVFLTLYDGGDPIEAGDAVHSQGRIFDIGSTLLGRAGLPVPASHEGVDLLSTSPPGFAYATCYNATVVRSREFKLVDFDLDTPWSKERHRPLDLVSGDYLYDLRSDPGEHENAASRNPAELERMREGLATYRARLDGMGPAPVAEESNLDETSRARLEALGYIEEE
jgi:arylsulfatase A-like enzyme